MLLADILVEEYALWFYAHMGVLHALEENNCLRVKACSGSSAGALVAAFLASGMKPTDMPPRVFSIKRENMWDMGLGLGLLKGQLFQKILEKQFPVKTFEECPIPLGITAYDVLGFKTNCVTTGDLATAVRASCCFPGLFQPVAIDDRLHIDGGVWDDGGLMALPYIPASNLIVNVVCGRGRIRSSVLPERFKDARLLTLVLDHIPTVSPFNMEKDGPLAFSIARAATFRMLSNGHLQQLSHNHWCAYIDGSTVDLSVPLTSMPPRVHSLIALSQQDNERTQPLSQSHPLTRHPSFQFHDKSRASVSTSSMHSVSVRSLQSTSSSSAVPRKEAKSSRRSSSSSSYSNANDANDTNDTNSVDGTHLGSNYQMKSKTTKTANKTRIERSERNAVQTVQSVRAEEPLTVGIAIGSVDADFNVDQMLEGAMQTDNHDGNDGNGNDEIDDTPDITDMPDRDNDDILDITHAANEEDLKVTKSARKRGRPSMSSSEPLQKTPKSAKREREGRGDRGERGESEKRKYSSRIESNAFTKILKRDRRPSFKLLDQ